MVLRIAYRGNVRYLLNTSNMKTFTIKTFGCKVNQYESQAIREKYLSLRYKEVSNDEVPSLCIVNTCCVTENAGRKSRQFVNRARKFYPDAKIIVAGCSVDYNPEDFKTADLLIPNVEKPQTGISDFYGHTRTFVKIQDGCEQFCTYCIVPYVRGQPRSRNFSEILDEVKRLVAKGYCEIVLTGIHLGEYDRFGELIKELEKINPAPSYSKPCDFSRRGGINSLLRIRLSSIEPQELTNGIVDIISKSSNICRHLHIPLQSGSDKILKDMNRRYSFAEYKKVTGNIRKKIPEVVFTTDIIVGFPGEAEKDFLLSCDAVEEIGFAKVHIFPYSDRPGTKAAGFTDKINPKEIKRRVKVLQDKADKTAQNIRRGMIGTMQEVLVEGTGRRVSGYTSGYIPVHIKNNVQINKLVKVKITGQNCNCLVG